MLPEDAPLRRRLNLEARTFERVVSQYGRWSPEGTRAERKVGELRAHIEEVEGRQPLEFWEAHLATLQAAEQIEVHYPDALVPLEIHNPNGRCRKCGGKPRVAWIENRLHETCKRCGFAWVTLPLDSALPAADDAPVNNAPTDEVIVLDTLDQ